MTAAIITIGDEILLGQLLDTNSRWIAEQLTGIGVTVKRMLSIGDSEEEIIGAVGNSNEDLLILTGGLGPTSDDRTKDALCRFYGTPLVLNEDVLNQIHQHFSGRPLADLERNKMQALVPANCTPLLNTRGTAPGMWFDDEHRIVISMPGVPEEMKSMMSDFVLPKLRTAGDIRVQHTFVMTAVIAESVLAEKLVDFETRMPKGVTLAYLPSPGRVKLRFTGTHEHQLESLAREAAVIIGDAAFAYGKEVSLEQLVGNLLRQGKRTLATAESCTGGFISHRITSVPGSSDYFKGSVISYSNEVKASLLGVSTETLREHGAVSEQTVQEMLQGVLSRLSADYGIAVSGIAGPAGGTPQKPVGTVWLAVGSAGDIRTRLLNLKGDRLRIIEVCGVVAMDELRKVLDKRQ